ncbi:MAG: EamA family transporter RarD [Eubacteriales bacterium]|nr:EamA family transporter RarD [Eubacteriales bacterium]
MKKKSLLLVLGCYMIWGVQPLYWALLDHMDAYFLMAARVLTGALFCLAYMAMQKRLPELIDLFRDGKRMKYLVPASLFLLADWAIFLVAVQNGNVLDTSLGYFMGPLVVFSLSVFLFKEPCGALKAAAIGLSVLGVAVTLLTFGRFPPVALVLALAFSIYGAIKKLVRVEPVLSITAETLILTPPAIVYILFFRMGENGVAALGGMDLLLLIGAGIVTVVPMILYSFGVNDLPLMMMGFFQYLSPSLSMICGFLMGEHLSPDRTISFAFIWAALAVFSFAVVREERQKRLRARKVISDSEDLI